MESPAQFSAFGAADDDSLLFDQAPPSAASSSRFMSTSSISPGGRGDEGDETADMTLRLENVGLAQDRPAQFQQQQQQSEDTFAFRGPPSSSTRPPPPGTRTDPEVYAAPARAAALEPEGAEEDASARVVRLKTERDRLRKLNESLERSITHFSGARGQLGRLQDNIQTTHGLMELWSNLMSQTEHTRHLVMDPNWTMDGDLQTLQAQLEAKERAEQEAQRKAAAEEEEARLAAIEREKQQQREEEEEERRRKAVAQSAEPSSKTRGVRGLSSRGTRIRGTTTSRTASTTGGASGIGRGSIPSAAATTGLSGSSNGPARGSAPVTGVRGVRGLRSRATATGGSRGRGANTS